MNLKGGFKDLNGVTNSQHQGYHCPPMNELAQVAESAARAAGRIIAGYRPNEIQVRHKSVGDSAASQVVTEVDHEAQAAILELLEPTCVQYGLALLTEESADDGRRLERPAFWSVDPMDGTLAFVKGTAGYSVSVALVDREGVPLVGVVCDPLEQTLYRAVSGQGAKKNGLSLTAPALDPARPLVLRTDPSFQTHPWLEATRSGLEAIAHRLGLPGAQIQYRTGAVMNACGILERPNACYFKYPRSGNSGGSLWDYAATACLFHEAGAVASDIYGRPLELNRPESTFMNHRGLLYAGNRKLADPIVALHRGLQAG